MQAQNLRRLILEVVSVATLASLSAIVPRHANAQAAPARSREASASAFVTYTRLSPDYGAPGNGVTVGADYTRLYRLLSPALEVRFKTGSGPSVSERTFGGGLRVEHQISYFHPYAGFLVSAGTITFANKSYIGSNASGSNNSIVYSYGGGLDYDFANQWAARVDFQSEHWDLKGNPALTLSPHALSLGIVYRIRLHRHQYD